jgi:hypothetical protein
MGSEVSAPSICTFEIEEDRLCGWSQAGNDLNWTVAESTPTANTGPSEGAAEGAGVGKGFFAYVDGSDISEGDNSILTSSTRACGLHFKYHMNGAGIGSLAIYSREATDSAEAIASTSGWTEEMKIEGSHGDMWKLGKVVTKYPGYSIGTARYWRINATKGAMPSSVLSPSGGNTRADIAIDNVDLLACMPDPPSSFAGGLCLIILFCSMSLWLIYIMKPAWKKKPKD